MSKYYITVIFLIFSALIFATEETYNLGEKEIVGENKQVFNREILIPPITEDKELYDKVNFDIEKYKAADFKDNKIENVKIEGVKTSDKPQFNINIYTKKVSINPTNSAIQKSFGSIYVNGLFYGFENADIRKYTIDYNSEYNKMKYSLGFKGETEESDRKNNKTLSNDFSLGLKYSGFELYLERKVSDVFLPGIETATVPFTSYKKEGLYNIEAYYNIAENTNKSYIIGIKSKVLNSERNSSTYLRDYNNKNFNVNGSYLDTINLFDSNNKITVNAGYIYDGTENFTSNITRLTFEDRLEPISDKATVFVINANIDADSKGTINLSALAGIEKSLNEKTKLSGEIAKLKKRKNFSEIMDNFTIDKDFQLPKDIGAEDEFYINGKISFAEKDFGGSVSLQHSSTINKIYYEENDSFAETPNEIPIVIKNYSRNISWQEILIAGNVQYDIFKGEMIYAVNNLNILPFQTGNIMNFNLTAEKEKNTLKFENKIVSDCFGKLNNQNKLTGYYKADLKYNYKLDDKINLGAYIDNVFENKYYFKTGYKADGRKVGIEIKLDY